MQRASVARNHRINHFLDRFEALSLPDLLQTVQSHLTQLHPTLHPNSEAEIALSIAIMRLSDLTPTESMAQPKPQSNQQTSANLF
jgi:hypothetical protein